MKCLSAARTRNFSSHDIVLCFLILLFASTRTEFVPLLFIISWIVGDWQLIFTFGNDTIIRYFWGTSVIMFSFNLHLRLIFCIPDFSVGYMGSSPNYYIITIGYQFVMQFRLYIYFLWTYISLKEIHIQQRVILKECEVCIHKSH